MTAIERLRDPRVADACTAVALAVALELQLALGDDPGASLVNVLGGLALTLPLAFRRRAPLAVALAFAAAAVLQGLLDGRLYAGEPPLLAALAAGVLAFFSLGAHAAERPALLGLAAGVGGLWATVLLSDHVDVRSFFFSAGLVALSPWLAGRTARARALRTAALERERDQRAQIAVAAERARIARDMHDIVAHNLAVMVALADGAALTATAAPARAAGTMHQVAATGREALGEMRRVLGLLREDGAGRTPQPGLDGLDALVERVRAAGVRVALTVEGVPGKWGAGAGVAVYRIVQEALTNTLKHAGPQASAHVRLRYRDGGAEVEVTDDGGQRVAAPAGAGGHGLTGMAERTAAYGGDVRAGPRDGTPGWRVVAHLPFDDGGTR